MYLEVSQKQHKSGMRELGHKIEKFEAELRSRICEGMKHEGFEVLAEVEEGWPIIQSIRNIIPKLTAVMILAKTSKMSSQITCDEQAIGSYEPYRTTPDGCKGGNRFVSWKSNNI